VHPWLEQVKSLDPSTSDAQVRDKLRELLGAEYAVPAAG